MCRQAIKDIVRERVLLNGIEFAGQVRNGFGGIHIQGGGEQPVTSRCVRRPCDPERVATADSMEPVRAAVSCPGGKRAWPERSRYLRGCPPEVQSDN